MASVVDEIESYIRTKDVDTLFKSLLVKCFRDRPDDPISFVFDELCADYPALAAERGLGAAVPARADEVSHDTHTQSTVVVKHSDKHKQRYLNDTLAVSNLFEMLSDQLAEQESTDPIQVVIDTCVQLKENLRDDVQQAAGEEEEEEGFNEEMDDDADEDEDGDGEDGDAFSSELGVSTPTRRPPPKLVRRPSVSAECTTSRELELEHRTVFEKTPEESAIIMNAVQDNILFKGLDERLRNDVLNAVFPKTESAGGVIIRQGDEGDNFYIIQSGEAEVFVTKNGATQHVLTSGPGHSFGELALMYNSPRAATVKAKSDMKMWALDRQTFRNILSEKTSKKRKMHEGFLGNVAVLSNLTDTERSAIADVLETKSFKAGECIIKQGDEGDLFYIVEDGKATARLLTGDGTERVVKEYGSGDYFGELALLMNKPRAASVVADAPTICCCIDSKSFRRLLGPCESIMLRAADSYKRTLSKTLLSD
mmetsp:Transcript_14045/g.46131  ORF Transcript_14045/g.46131 Transcript_14045/m.46131 type:complete len:481 (-) Transcript_14045:117-1559(-)